MKPWDNPKYQKIVDVDIEDGCLSVEFANGDRPAVPLFRLSSRVSPSKAHELTQVHLRMNAYEVKVNYFGEKLVIPWDSIRFHSDPVFARAMLELAEQNRNRIGLTLCLWREQAGITIIEMAAMLGKTQSIVRNMETEYADVPFDVLRKYLKILGKTLRDLVEAEEQKKFNIMRKPTKAELDAQYKGVHILVDDEKHPDYGKKCSFVEMVKKSFQKGYLMKVEIMTEKRTLELHAKQVFVITAEIPLPSAKDN